MFGSSVQGGILSRTPSHWRELHTHQHRHTQRVIHTHTYCHTHIQTHTHRHTQTQPAHTNTPMQTHKASHTHKLTHTQEQNESTVCLYCSVLISGTFFTAEWSCFVWQSPLHTHTHTCARTHTHAHTHAHTHTCTHTHTCLAFDTKKIMISSAVTALQLNYKMMYFFISYKSNCNVFPQWTQVLMSVLNTKSGVGEG